MTKKNWFFAFAFALPWTLLILILRVLIREHLTTTDFILIPILGVAAGAVLARIIDGLEARLISKNIVEIGSDEKLIKEGISNHYRKKKGIAGKLALTNKRLIFQAHSLSVPNRLQSFDLKAIHAAETSKTLNLLNNGLTIRLRKNEEQTFTVDKPQEWVSTIAGLKNP